MDPSNLNLAAKTVICLLKKWYLLTRRELELPWRPLFKVFRYWEDSSYANR